MRLLPTASMNRRKPPAPWMLAGAMICLLLIDTGCVPVPPALPPIAAVTGTPTLLNDTYGNFYAYVPASASAMSEILVLVHGTPPDDTSAEETAAYYVNVWQDFAEERHLILLAPAFNQEDYSSRLGDRALGGYRGLFGRKLDADAWVLRLVSAYQKAFGDAERHFYLYGHSAGGQFSSRFLIRHAAKVKRAVISSAATYLQPVTDVGWPFGMGELHTDLVWDNGDSTPVDVIPTLDEWLAATQVPVVVIVGLNDTSELPAYPGQRGKNRFTIARNWVKDMSSLAAQNGLASQIGIAIIPGKGHSMSGLANTCQAALFPDPSEAK